MLKYYLKYIYLKTRIHQKIFRDGSFPFKHYNIFKKYIALIDKDKIQALECGTALGLTAISITSSSKNIYLDTIEKYQRNIDKAKNNFLPQKSFWSYFVNLQHEYKNTNFIQGIYQEVFKEESYKNKKYDFIFLDAYVSRIREVEFFVKTLNPGGIFAVSNIRENIKQSKEAKDFLLNGGENNNLNILDIIEDTIFVQKIR